MIKNKTINSYLMRVTALIDLLIRDDAEEMLRQQ
jgi:hypothetical protein